MLMLMRTAAWLAVAAWGGLLVARGKFWDARADRLADPAPDLPQPAVHAVVPARNEADVIGRTLASVLAQRYSGRFTTTVVDDRSDDGTATVAAATIAAAGAAQRAYVHRAAERPEGWTGKVWALAEGVAAARSAGQRPAYWWLSDADVEHDSDTLARLVATAERERRALVSQMVALHCARGWEPLLIPAFVFFFRMLYPFDWVNDDRRSTAGAAGGCVLVADDALDAIGGLAAIRAELIDDCSLAAAVKRTGGGLWLGLATRSRSIRPYRDLASIWMMVARTAYTQLRYSPTLLAGTVAAMLVLYVAPPAALAAGTIRRRPALALPGALGWGLMTAAYVPTVRRYAQPWWLAFTLPLAGVLYTAMTVDSARRHARRTGGTWKGRHFTPPVQP
jgi:hopene-associated glycosyltransferase HpnB